MVPPLLASPGLQSQEQKLGNWSIVFRLRSVCSWFLRAAGDTRDSVESQPPATVSPERVNKAIHPEAAKDDVSQAPGHKDREDGMFRNGQSPADPPDIT